MDAQQTHNNRKQITWQTHLIIALVVFVPIVLMLASVMYIVNFEQQYLDSMHNTCIHVEK